MSVALVTVFKTAMEGKTPELAQTPIPLTAELPAVPARGGEELVRKLFEPLGYEVDGARHRQPPPRRAHARRATHAALRAAPAPVRAAARCSTTRSTTGSTTAEIEKLMRRGEGWLPEHPERALITRRYLKHEWRLVNPALAALGELEPADDRHGDRAGAPASRCKRPAARHGPGRAQGLGRAERASISAAAPARCWSGCSRTATPTSPARTSPPARSRSPSGG